MSIDSLFEGRRRLSVLAAFAVIAGALALASPALATFPGANGRIAFIRDSNVFTMKPDGSAVRQLTSFGGDTGVAFEAWSADATKLVFDVFPPEASAQVWIMNADGSGQRLLLDDPDYDDFTPSFSPDGSHVVFVRCPPVEGQGCAVHRVRTDGSHLTAITHFQLEVSDWNPLYAPDGRTIAFTSFARDGVLAATYLMHANGSGIRSLTPPEPELLAGDWSPDGSRIVMISNVFSPRNGDIWTVKPSGRGLRQLIDTPEQNDTAPTWSPQGDAIAFERLNDTFTDSSIFVMRTDGSHVKPIQDHARYPRWGSAR